MDTRQAMRVAEMTNEFYREHAKSFSDTRQRPWVGWSQALMAIVADLSSGDKSHAYSPKEAEGKDDNLFPEIIRVKQDQTIRVLDLACGNMRFASFLENAEVSADVTGVDINADLASFAGEKVSKTHDNAFASNTKPQRPNRRKADIDTNMEQRNAGLQIATDYIEMDIISELQNNSLLGKLSNIHPKGFDLAVCFGFFHHIPTTAMRERAISDLCACVRPGGYAVLSFWQFMRDPKIAAKAERATNTAGDTRHINLEAQDGDFFLGWQGDCETLRYCHDYSETEIDKLVDFCGAQEIARFSADGKSGNLNRYVVLRIPDATQL